MYRIVFSLMILFGVSCSDPKPIPTIDQQILVGKWDLHTGFRNGKETETLRGAYFDFLNDSTVVTNILGNEDPSFFYWQDSSILVTSVVPPIQYFIKNLTTDSLHLSFSQNRYQFDLILNPSEFAQDSPEAQGF
ncbi:MAG: hypothetical protein KJP00_07070 [Bacteroidia bacterium]|nr:hypothetical protein [Bacteroidia bacterium]